MIKDILYLTVVYEFVKYISKASMKYGYMIYASKQAKTIRELQTETDIEPTALM